MTRMLTIRNRPRWPRLNAIAFVVLWPSCAHEGPATVAVTSQAAPAPHDEGGAPSPETTAIDEAIYDGGPGGWADWGWARREVTGPGPAKVDFSNFGGWILAKPGFSAPKVGTLVFRIRPPEGDVDFLAVKIIAPSSEGPDVKITADQRSRLGPGFEGWEEVRVPLSQLNPDGLDFDRVVLHAMRPTKGAFTLIDKIGLTKARIASAGDSPPPPAAPAAPISMSIACDGRATPISPFIYGIAYYQPNESQESQWQMGATIRRWGGNTTSTYNWQLEAWNLGSDWYYENKPIASYRKFLEDDAAHGIESALTVPIMGWVARDTTSVGFPVSAVGPQRQTDPWNAEAGNGETKDGRKIPSTPSRTGTPATREWLKAWVQAIRANDARSGRRSVRRYILDNEPGIWHLTHRDMHPEPLGYDELVERTIQFGSAIREADPEAVIAGPAEYGWGGYLFSGKDQEHGWAKTDRKGHGDVPLIEFYLSKLHEYERRTGVRVLDVVDLHFYPEAANLSTGTDERTNALRIRTTRSLWDPTYVDESWIKEAIHLLPRMKEWIARDYPGRGISIGEWNFTGESSMSGGLATAEALGRFAQYGVDSAYYWSFPPADSPAMRAFLAYRNFDAKGGHFLDWFLPSKVQAGAGLASLFASRDEAGKHIVAIALNFSPETSLLARIDTATCGVPDSRQAYVSSRAGRNTEPQAVAGSPTVIERVLPPYSITVIDVRLREPLTGAVVRAP
jgi:hypothetical protein